MLAKGKTSKGENQQIGKPVVATNSYGENLYIGNPLKFKTSKDESQ